MCLNTTVFFLFPSHGEPCKHSVGLPRDPYTPDPWSTSIRFKDSPPFSHRHAVLGIMSVPYHKDLGRKGPLKFEDHRVIIFHSESSRAVGLKYIINYETPYTFAQKQNIRIQRNSRSYLVQPQHVKYYYTGILPHFITSTSLRYGPRPKVTQ